MKVLKFGGTSVGTPAQMKKVAGLVTNDEKKIVVLSAVSGTTNQLEKIGKELYQQRVPEALKLVDQLEASHVRFCEELYSSKEYQTRGIELIRAHSNYIRSFTRDLFTIYEERAILAQGELISTALFHYFLEESNVKSVLLPALDFMRVDKDGDPDEWYIKTNLEKELAQKEENIFITQGYICRNAYGEIDNLKRGGSDYSASLIGAAIEAEEIQIWTDIDGMHNNDPRVVDSTSPISQLSFDEAAELAYFGAKILHPSSILPARKNKIPVRLKSTMKPEAEGTLISNESGAGKIKAIAAKDKISAIKIKSGRMLLAYGFLRRVFEVFERYKTSIDMITTSEVALSVTIDELDHVEEIVGELREFGSVEVDHDQVIVCIVGDFLQDKQGYADQIFTSLKEIPIRMISYGGSRNNISILIGKDDKARTLNALHEGLFKSTQH